MYLFLSIFLLSHILSPDFKRNMAYRKWVEGSLGDRKKILQTVPGFHSYLWNLEIYPKHIYIFLIFKRILKGLGIWISKVSHSDVPQG